MSLLPDCLREKVTQARDGASAPPSDVRFSARPIAGTWPTAIRLAWRGRYGAHPNPRVGCVIVSGGEIVGRGWHRCVGEAHAEVNALAEAGERARGDRCICHPRAVQSPGSYRSLCRRADRCRCSAASLLPWQIRFRRSRVKGSSGLQRTASMSPSASWRPRRRRMNQGYLSRLERGRPFVRLKIAASLDGATAMQSGESQWITGPAARRDVQRLRATSGAIMTGIGTILDDDPSLTVRELDVPAQPLRVVLDSSLARHLSMHGCFDTAGGYWFAVPAILPPHHWLRPERRTRRGSGRRSSRYQCGACGACCSRRERCTRGVGANTRGPPAGLRSRRRACYLSGAPYHGERNPPNVRTPPRGTRSTTDWDSR